MTRYSIHTAYQRFTVAVYAMTLVAIAALWPYKAAAQTLEDLVSYDQEIRENPFMPDVEDDDDASIAIDYGKYPFLNLNSNRIEMNGADWSRLRQLFEAVDDTVVSIVHIGDSHLQAEGATTRTRSLLQRRYGSSGRGLITPFRMAGTNQPNDYTITSDSKFATSVLLRKPWGTTMGFTGIGIEPMSEFYDLTLTTKAVDGREQDFDCIRMFGSGTPPELLSAYSPGEGDVKFTTEIQGSIMDIYLAEGASEVKLDLHSEGAYTMFGFALYNSMTGVEFHVIGNNGARYDCYTELPDMGRDVGLLFPELVMISLGTNEAFGKISDDTFYANIDRLVKDIRKYAPQAQILLTTPAECQRSVRVKKKKSYAINENIDRLRKVILKYGRDNNIATYDWYDVAGGRGSSNHWVADGLLSKDRIHCTWTGYHLQGNLMYDALIDAIDNMDIAPSSIE